MQVLAENNNREQQPICSEETAKIRGVVSEGGGECTRG